MVQRCGPSRSFSRISGNQDHAPGGAGTVDLQPDVRTWNYEFKDGTRGGPIGTAELIQCLATGRIAADVKVWCQEIGEWTPAAAVAELTSNVHTSFELSNGNNSGEMNSPGVARALGGSRLWVVLIAVVVFTYASLFVLTGGYFVVVGAGKGVALAIFCGVLTVILGILCAAGGTMLINHGRHIGKFVAQPGTESLISALDALRVFWMYMSILLIVALAFIVFALIAVVTMASGFA